MNENKPLIEDYKHRIKLQTYNDETNQAWESSAEYLEIMGDKLAERQKTAYDIKYAARGRNQIHTAQRQAEIDAINSSAPQVVHQPVYQQPQQPQYEDSAQVMKLLKQYMSVNNLSVDDELSGVEIARSLNLNPTSVRGAIKRMRDKATKSNGNAG